MPDIVDILLLTIHINIHEQSKRSYILWSTEYCYARDIRIETRLFDIGYEQVISMCWPTQLVFLDASFYLTGNGILTFMRGSVCPLVNRSASLAFMLMYHDVLLAFRAGHNTIGTVT